MRIQYSYFLQSKYVIMKLRQSLLSLSPMGFDILNVSDESIHSIQLYKLELK
jgi:hypothetical protein